MDSNENNLIKELINGNRKAFTYFFGEYYNVLHQSSYQYLNDWDESEEIVQEVFYRVWYYRKKMNASLSFRAYIYTIARRLILNKFRKRNLWDTYEKYFKRHNVESEDSLQDFLNVSELDQQINCKIQLLPPKRKEIFILSRQDGLSHKEIAKKMNISPNTVDSQISKAIKFIKASLT